MEFGYAGGWFSYFMPNLLIFNARRVNFLQFRKSFSPQTKMKTEICVNKAENHSNLDLFLWGFACSCVLEAFFGCVKCFLGDRLKASTIRKKTANIFFQQTLTRFLQFSQLDSNRISSYLFLFFPLALDRDFTHIFLLGADEKQAHRRRRTHYEMPEKINLKFLGQKQQQKVP